MEKKLISILNHRKSKSEQIHEYWKNPSENNLPEKYSNPKGGLIRSKMLLRLIQENTDIAHTSSIMELGCNVGRNLNLLMEENFQNIHGVEINKNAISQMQEIYPKLRKCAKITIGSLENTVTEYPQNHFDLVFTMAVLEHIHKDSEWIFAKIERFTKKYLITIEDEKTVSDRHFPRNYKDIFEQLDMKQVFYYDCSEMLNWKGKFQARVFKKMI